MASNSASCTGQTGWRALLARLMGQQTEEGTARDRQLDAIGRELDSIERQLRELQARSPARRSAAGWGARPVVRDDS